VSKRLLLVGEVSNDKKGKKWWKNDFLGEL
jgi:hypothetical protein